MKLFYADLSPYARKVRVTIAEKGLGDRVEMTSVNPYEIPEELNVANPLCKVPTLVTDSGDALYDSAVICEYLDNEAGGAPLIPEGAARFDMLRRHALANGIIDAAFNVACEINRRDEGERSPKWIKHWVAAISRGVDQLDREIGEWPQALDLAHITAGCALSYLDIRLSNQLDWRAGHPALTAWHEDFAARPSMVASQPKM